jgi:predicted DNA-binding transcriptional regulator
MIDNRAIKQFLHPMPRLPLQESSVRQLLGRLGLDEKEVEVYLALFPLRVARVAAISKAAGQSRSHTYLVLRSLERKGLVSEIERGKVIHFVAEPPERLLAYLEDKEREIRSLKPLVQGVLPLLQNISGPLIGRPRVTLLQGIDGMKQIYRDFLVHEFVGIMNVQVMYDAFGTTAADLLFDSDIALRGRDLLVDNDAARRYMREWVTTDVYDFRLLPKHLFFDTDTIVYGDTTVIFAYDDEKTIIRIDSHNVANSFRAWFEGLWEMSKPLGKRKS